ncbi:MAG: hypothetical protein HYV67_04445 [Candidatus Taylorbacteria bacterium]|nr:hypothetical protein [Candidatus Taylorbacteria bacterium]
METSQLFTSWLVCFLAEACKAEGGKSRSFNQPSTKGVIVSVKKSVLVCFNPSYCPSETAVNLLEALRKVCHYEVMIPATIEVPNGAHGITKIGRLDEFKGLKPFCLFLTPSLSQSDDFLAGLLEQAKAFKLKRHGFILKPQGGRLVTTATFEMFQEQETDFCNAIKDVEEIVHCVQNILV